MEQPLKTDDEVSLGSYVLVLLSWWRDIAVVSIAGAALGVVAVWTLDLVLPRYDAYADVAIIQTGANVAIDERFGVMTNQDARLFQRRLAGRRAALLGLVHKSSLAQTVSEALPPEDEYSPSSLLLKVTAKLVTFGVASQHPESDLIRITVRMESPQRAKYVADTWADVYVQDINQLYESVPQQVIATILQERDDVRKQYQDAEAALQQFMAASQIDFLATRIASLQQLNTELMEVWKQGTALRYIEQGNSAAQQLKDNYARERTLVSSIRMAASLRDLLATTNGDNGASTDLATALLMADIYGGSTPVEISFDTVASGDSSSKLAELDALVEALDARLAKVKEENEALNESIDVFLGTSASEDVSSLLSLNDALAQPIDEQPLLTLMNDIERDKQALVAQKQLETATLADLTLVRDLRRSTLETLQNEVVELQLRATASPSAVRLASYSLAPSISAWPSPLLGGFAALLVASFGGVCMAFAANAMGRRPFFRRAAPGAQEQA